MATNDIRLTGFSKSKPVMSDAKLRDKKATQAHLSLASGGLGLAGLGTLAASKAPKAAVAPIARAMPKVAARVNRKKMLGASGALVTGSAGVGGIGSLNFARIQNTESRKTGPRPQVIVVKHPVKKSDSVSAFGVEHYVRD